MCQFAAAIAATDQAPRNTPAEYHPSGIPGKRYPCPGCGTQHPPSYTLLCAACTDLYRRLNSYPDATPAAARQGVA